MRNRRRKQEQPELNITAFLNLMVVLIPFLLLNAVFTQLSVIELNLPKSGDGASAPKTEKDKTKPPVDLQVLLLKKQVVLHDKISSKDIIKLPLNEEGFDSKALHDSLKSVKSQLTDYPEVKGIRILASQDTSYEMVIKTMDAVRYFETPVNGQMDKKELFPKISLGNAPTKKGGQG